MAVSLSPLFNPDHAVSDANGDPRSGAKLFTYANESSTKVTTYKDSDGSVAHTNPIVLDASGLPPAPIWLTQGATYTFVLAPPADTDPPASAILTINDITGINDVADAVVNEWVSGTTPTYISGTSFSVTGDQTSTLHVNRRLKLTVTGVALYAYIIKSVYTSLTTVTVLVDGGTSLTSGLTAMSYGIVSGSTNTSLPFLSYDQQCCRLNYVSATSIRLDPQDGKMIWVYTGASGWTRRSVSSSGVTAANTSTYVNGTAGQSLVATTTYFVYLFDNSGTLTMDFSTTAPAVDATSGLKIKTGDPTRLLVGMVRTNGSTPGQFQTPGLVLSWYKRRAIRVTGAVLSSASTGSTSYVEIQTAAQVKFLTWAEEAIHAMYIGDTRVTVTNPGTTGSAVTLDGIATVIGAIVSGTSHASAYQVSAVCGGWESVAEGYHYVTLIGKVSTGTGTWNDNSLLQVLTQG
jgi:hypothetical protein